MSRVRWARTNWSHPRLSAKAYFPYQEQARYDPESWFGTFSFVRMADAALDHDEDIGTMIRWPPIDTKSKNFNGTHYQRSAPTSSRHLIPESLHRCVLLRSPDIALWIAWRVLHSESSHMKTAPIVMIHNESVRLSGPWPDLVTPYKM